MEEALFIVRHVRAVVWFIVICWLAGSAWRTFANRLLRDYDPSWMLFWLIGVSYFGYSGRYLFGLAEQPEAGVDMVTMLGLNVLITGIGFGVMWRRYIREGWRW